MSLLSTTAVVSTASVCLTSCKSTDNYEVVGLDNDIKVVYHDTTVIDLALKNGDSFKDNVVWSAANPVGNYSSVSFNGSQMIVNGKEIGNDKYKVYAKTPEGMELTSKEVEVEIKESLAEYFITGDITYSLNKDETDVKDKQVSLVDKNRILVK